MERNGQSTNAELPRTLRKFTAYFGQYSPSWERVGKWDMLNTNPTAGHGYLSVVSVMCCQVEVCATD